MVEALRGAEAAAAQDKAASGYTAVALDDAFRFYCDVLARRYSGTAAVQGGTVNGTGSHWRAAAAAGVAVSEGLARAQACVAGGLRGPALRWDRANV